MQTSAPWDLFCRVVDNFGDIGVCWRLAADLASRGQPVRLWLDDTRALAWMAPHGASGVTVLPWSADALALQPAGVVIEAFGCTPPAHYITAMARRKLPPLWINLEYLSAESYVARCHGLPSPQLEGPGRGLMKWFFYPGFVPGTGGLLRESALSMQRATFDGTAWLGSRGWAPRAGERVVSLFCYPQAPVPDLLRSLQARPTLLLLTPGAAQQAVRALPAPSSALRCIHLPWLTQGDYDRLLWASDLNLVRGEDSLVRALWAGAPLLWQIYPQDDGAHALKLDAFLQLYLKGANAGLADDLGGLWRAWNGLAAWPEAWPEAWPDTLPWTQQAGRFRDHLLAQPDLVSQLLEFVHQKR